VPEAIPSGALGRVLEVNERDPNTLKVGQVVDGKLAGPMGLTRRAHLASKEPAPAQPTTMAPPSTTEAPHASRADHWVSVQQHRVPSPSPAQRSASSHAKPKSEPLSMLSHKLVPGGA
jgi:hypothetical protein